MPEGDFEKRLTSIEGNLSGMEERLGRMLTDLGSRVGELVQQVNGIGSILFRVDAEHRLASIEGRLSALAAGQSAHELALMRLAETQADHTARFGGMDKRFDGIERTLADILIKLGA